MQVVRNVALIDDSCPLELKDCLYVSKSIKNLISVSSLCKLNYSMVFNDETVFINMNNLFIFLGSLVDNIYQVSPLFVLLSNENYHISLQTKKT